MFEIKDQFDPVLRKTINSEKQIAVIPIGSIEQHGPHLPISTDTDIVTEISRKLSKKLCFVLLPSISYGVSYEHRPFFNLSISSSTLKKILVDLCLSLSENNIKTIFLINGHHGNLTALKGVESLIRKKSNNKINVFVLSYWHYMQSEFDHAGIVETSLMLAISKNVKMKLAKKGLITDGMTSNQLKSVKKLANKSFPRATKNGVWGDPRNASKEKGLEIMSEVLKNLEKKCQTCLTEHGL